MTGIRSEHNYDDDPWYEELRKLVEEQENYERTKHYRKHQVEKIDIYKDDRNNPKTPKINPYQED